MRFGLTAILLFFTKDIVLDTFCEAQCPGQLDYCSELKTFVKKMMINFVIIKSVK